MTVEYGILAFFMGIGAILIGGIITWYEINYNEKDLTCAIREFEEETGYKNADFNIVYNILPYEEIFTGSNFKSYKHKYFICKFNH